MTEAISVVAPARRRTAGAITLGPRPVVAGAADHRCCRSPDRGDLRCPVDHVRRAGAYRRRHAAARRGRIHLRAAASAAGARRRGDRPLSRRLPLAERRRHVDRGPADFLRKRRPSRCRDADPGAGWACCRSLSLVSSGLALDEPLCRAGRGRSGRDRARQPAGVPGAFRARDNRRTICRDLYGAFFAFLLWLERPSPGAGCCSALPSRSRSVPSCRRCCFFPRLAARCCSTAGCASGRTGSRSELFASWRSVAGRSRAAFLLTVWVGLRLQFRPALWDRTPRATASRARRLRGQGDPVFFSRRDQLARQLGLLSGADPGQVADAVSRRSRDRRCGAAPLASPGLAAHGAAGRRRSDRRERHSVDDQYRIAAHPAGVSTAGDRRRDRARRGCSRGTAMRQRAAWAGLLVVWQVGEAAAAAPDYLTYFNQLASASRSAS